MPTALQQAARSWVKRARRGLYAGRTVLSGDRISEDGGNRTRRKWKPNVHRKSLYSVLLQRVVPLRVTSHALRCIDKAGGLDPYILNTPDHKLGSDVGMALRAELMAVRQRAAAPAAAGQLPESEQAKELADIGGGLHPTVAAALEQSSG